MALNIWRFTDGKPGHDSQSIGLCTAIEQLKTCHRFDVSATPLINSIALFLAGRFNSDKDLPKPDLIIGAGHGTHLSMLAAQRAHGGQTIVLMKPSLPRSLFDVCIIPKHDLVPDSSRVITTEGALNPVQSNKNKSPDSGLILLGGLSRHYHWSEETVIEQLETIITSMSDVNWIIADSPRTPESILTKLDKQNHKNIHLLNYSETNTTQIHNLIFDANYIWVSADSVSMIYESLSSGASVGLIELKNKEKSRMANAISSLVNENKLTTFSKWQQDRVMVPGLSNFNEAKRSADLLLARGILG
jgi:uncharacterized protein